MGRFPLVLVPVGATCARLSLQARVSLRKSSGVYSESSTPSVFLPRASLEARPSGLKKKKRQAFAFRYQHGVSVRGFASTRGQDSGSGWLGSFSSFIQPSCTKAQVVVPVVSRIPVPVSRPAVLGVVVPAAAAVDAVRATLRAEPFPQNPSPEFHGIDSSRKRKEHPNFSKEFRFCQESQHVNVPNICRGDKSPLHPLF